MIQFYLKSSISKKIVLCLAILFLFWQKPYAQVTVTPANLSFNTCGFPSAWHTLGNILIDENNFADFNFPDKSNQTFTLNAPANFEFNTNILIGNVYYNSLGDITNASVSVTATAITVKFRSNQNNRVNEYDYFRFENFQIRAINGASTGNILSSGAAVITGITNGTTNFGTLTSTASTISGTYTVGAAGNFTTLTDAVNAYNTHCLTGPVVFSLIDNSYSASETFPIVIMQNASASAINTLTIKPASSINASITGSPASPDGVIHISGRYITIDGSNVANGTTRNLTITQNNNSGTPYCVRGISNSTVSVEHITIKNTVLVNDQTSNTGALVFTASTATAGTLDPGYFKNLTIVNNQIRRANIGIGLIGAVAAGNGQNINISDNVMDASSANNAIYTCGILVSGISNSVIHNNTLANFLPTDANNDVGIQIGSDVTNTSITNNKIFNLKNTNSLGNGSYGMLIATGKSNANIIVANNSIAGITGLGYDYTSSFGLDNPTGILIGSTQSGIKIYHNSINMDGGIGNTLNKTNALSSGIRIVGSSVADIRNNIIQNNLGLNSTGYGAVGILVENLTQLGNLNNNVYYVNPTGTGNKILGQIGTTGYTTLATWQTATSAEAEGINTMPSFLSATDLHLTASPSTANFFINNEGTPLAAVTLDIDGDTRNGYTPDPGMDEFKGTGSWIGKTSSVWELTGNTSPGGNWDDGIVPTSVLNAKIGNAPNMPVINSISASKPVNDLYIENPGTLTIQGNGVLQLYGNFYNKLGSINALDGSIEFKGANAQSLPSGLLVGDDIKNIIISNTSGTAPQVQLNAPVKLYEGLSFGNVSSKTLQTNNNLSLKSTAAGTAWVADLTNNGTNTNNKVLGNLSVERYVEYTGNWNLLTAPINNSQSIQASWQDNASAHTSTGYGTQVTGPATPTPVGFDGTSLGYSLKWWNSATSAFDPVINTQTSLVNQPSGYFIFARGDRGYGPNTTGPNTTLKANGPIFMGYSGSGAEPTVLNAGAITAGNFVSVANPFASAIDFGKVLLNSGKINRVKPAYYLWDPSLTGYYGVGQYRVMSSTNGWVPTPTVATSGPNIYPSGPFKQVQNGQAFFIESATGAGNVTIGFDENDKITGSELLTRGNPNPDSLVMMSTMLHHSNQQVLDGNRVVFHSDYSNTIADEDATKILNAGENFGLLTGGKKLIVEGRQPIVAADTIFYTMSNLRTQNYTLSFEPLLLQNAGLSAELIDKYLHTRTPVSLSDSSFYQFAATADAASKAADRFMLVFRAPGSTLPLTFINITAVRLADRSIKVNWQVANEINIEKYEVERSADGLNFTGILTGDATNSNHYSKNDLSPLAADNFYRIKAIGHAGDVTYSEIVKIAPNKQPAFIAVQPNPVKNKLLHIKFNEVPQGKYQVQLSNSIGQLVYSGTVNVLNNNFIETIKLKPATAAGTYNLIINNQGKLITTETVIIE